MANHGLPSQECFANSPFGVMRKARQRRGNLILPPPNTEANERVYNLMMERLFLLCRNARISKTTDPVRASESVFGQRLAPSYAWSALIKDFETAHADLVAAEEPIRISIAFARGRICAMQKAEHLAFVKLQANKAAEARSRQYEAERQEDGGTDAFFNSNTWKRLRFEVLAERSGCCDLCGRSYREHGVALEVDHIKPRSRFPSLAMDKDNLQILCFDCNRSKSNRDTTDWRSPQEQIT
jgi:hypothetical protein